MKTLTQYIQESMLKHIALEMKNYDIIYEKYGVYDGCEDLVKFIKNKIRNSENFNNIEILYNDVKNIDNIFFNTLTISFSDSDELGAAYKVDENQIINEKTKLFDNVFIEIKLKFSNKNYKVSPSLDSLLCHELTHAYNDYLIQYAGNKTFFDLFNDINYERSKYFKNTKYHPDLRQFLRALYMLNDYERNSFISMLSIQINQIKEKYKNEKSLINVNDIFYEIQGLDIYKSYIQIIQFIECYTQGALYKKDKEEIRKEWYRAFREDIDIDKIFRKLQNKIIKLKNKLETVIPKKIAESINSNHNKIIIENFC